MKVAIVEFESEQAGSAILAKQKNTEELRANSISIQWQPHHVVFYLTLKNDGRVYEDMIAYRATDVVSIDMQEMEE